MTPLALLTNVFDFTTSDFIPSTWPRHSQSIDSLPSVFTQTVSSEEEFLVPASSQHDLQRAAPGSPESGS